MRVVFLATRLKVEADSGADVVIISAQNKTFLKVDGEMGVIGGRLMPGVGVRPFFRRVVLEVRSTGAARRGVSVHRRYPARYTPGLQGATRSAQGRCAP
jgi:hypothetical protein